MLHKLDIAVDHRLRNLVLGGIQFHFIKGRGSANLIDRIIQKIAGAWLDLPHGPAIAAYIVAGHKAAVRPGGVGVYQLAIIENAVGCPCKGSVALGGPGLGVRLYHMDAELL